MGSSFSSRKLSPNYVKNKTMGLIFYNDYIRTSIYNEATRCLFTGEMKQHDIIPTRYTILKGSIRLPNGLILKGDFADKQIYYCDIEYEYNANGCVKYQKSICDDIIINGGENFIYVKRNGYIYKCNKIVNSHPVGDYIMFDRDGGKFTYYDDENKINDEKNSTYNSIIPNAPESTEGEIDHSTDIIGEANIIIGETDKSSTNSIIAVGEPDDDNSLPINTPGES